VFRNNIFELDHVVSQYNNIKLTVLDVERPLIQERVNTIDKQFEQVFLRPYFDSYNINKW